MEKRRVRLFLLAAGIAPLALCGNEASAVQLQLKLTQGKTYYQKTLIELRAASTIAREPQVGDVSVGIGQKLEVLDVDRAGNMWVRYTFVWIMAKRIDNQTTETDYDSARQTTPPEDAAPVAALLHQSYVVRLTPRGRVLDVNGVEQMKETIQKKAPVEALDNRIGRVTACFLQKQGVKEFTELLLAVYPDQPVEPGQSWSDKNTLQAGWGRIEDTKWTLQKSEAGVALISTTSTVVADPRTQAAEAREGIRVKYDLSGTHEGTIRIVEATGLIQMAQSLQQFKGQVRFGYPPQPEMTMPLTLEAKTTTEMSEKMGESGPADK